MKQLTAKEFRELGYLQEVNRLFLHPRGLALEVLVERDGTETFGGVWDFRDDPEGIAFTDEALTNGIAQDNVDRVQGEFIAHEDARIVAFGSAIQPVPRRRS